MGNVACAMSVDGPNFVRTRPCMARPSTHRWISLLIPVLLLVPARSVEAQPICSIALGPDTTICEGTTVTLTAPPGYPQYNWSTGATTESITVGSAGVYACSVTYPTGDLAVNPGFDNGNTGFTSMFDHALPLTTDGNYWIGTNANLLHPQWVGTGNGPFLMVNAGWMHSGFRFWCQTHEVCPGQTYTISFRAMSLASQGPPLLSVSVNGAEVGLVQTSAVQGQWNNYSVTWTAPAGVTSGDFCIEISSGHGVGNDLGFDDVSISANVVLTDEVVVNVTPLPVVDLGPDATLCTSQSLMLDAGVPGGTYLWQDGSTDPSFNVTGPGTYSVTVTSNGCSNTDEITVDYNPTPEVDLGPDLSLCAGETILLDATMPGATYTWQDGSTGPTYLVNGPGFYSVSVLLDGCPASDNVQVDEIPLPVVDLGPDVVLCAGEQVTFDAAVPGATYLWQDGSTDPTFTTSTAGTFSVTVTLNGCSASDAVDVAVNPLPVVDLGPDRTLCEGESIVLDATVPGATYTWHDGSTAPTFTVTQAGNYSVTVLLNGCPASDAVAVNYNPLPVVDLGPDVSLCAGEQVTFDATVPGATYTWQDGSTTPTLTTSTAGNYSVEVTLNGCSATDAANVIVNPIPAFDLGPDQTFCPGDDVVLNATVPGATHLWNTGATSPTITVSDPGTYSVEVTLNGCSATDAITLDLFDLQTVDLGPDVTICQGSSTTLGVVIPGATYLWNNGATTPTLNVSTAGLRWVDVTLNGCTVRDSIQVIVSPLPIVDLGSDHAICSGHTTVLSTALTGVYFQWSTGETTPTILVPAGTYSVAVTNGAGCSASDEITITNHPIVEFDLGNDTTLCEGSNLVLQAPPNGQYNQWSDGSIGDTFTVTVPGTYGVVHVDSNGCDTMDEITVSFLPAPVVDLGADVSICPGQSHTINGPAIPGATYLWSTGETTPSITVSTTGTYSLTVTVGECSTTDAVNVTVLPLPVVDLGPDIALCPGESAVLDATVAGGSYQWNTGATTPTISVSNAGTYSVQVTVDGCTSSDAVGVSVLSTSAVDLGPDTTICAGSTVTLDATMPGATYLWNTGATTPTITVGAAGSYSVEVSQGQCSVSDAVVVSVLPAPVVDLGGDQVLCNGETSLLLDATNTGATYLWNTAATTPTLQVTSSGTYSVEVELNGCTAIDAVTITFGTVTFDLGADTLLCPGATLVLEVPLGNGTILWNGGPASGPTFTVTGPGTYWAEFVATNGGCGANDTIVVAYAQPGALDLGPDLTICAGTSTTLDATLPGAIYLWSTGSTSPTIEVATAGTYSVTATVGNCTAEDEIVVTVQPLPTPDIGPDAAICPGATATFDATTPSATYLWHDGSSAPTYTTDQAGHVHVTVTVGECSASDEAAVTILDAPVVELGNDTTLCAPGTLVLDVTTPGATYLWNDGSTAPTLVVSNAGGYSVTVTLHGCTDTDAITVDVFEPANVTLGPDVQLCPGTTTMLATGLNGVDHLWSTGATSPSITVGAAGIYWVEAGIPGCMARDSVVVSVVPLPTVDLGPDLTFCAGDTTQLAVQAGAATVNWNTGATTPMIDVWQSGTYTVTLTLAGCTTSDAVQVAVLDSITDLGLPAEIAYCLGQDLRLQVTDVAGATYLWNTGASGPWLQVTMPGTYHVQAEGPCMLASAVVEVIEGDCAPFVHVPNAFTPNDDGFNDVFKPVIHGTVLSYRFDIHDRWGEQIFTTTDPNDAWDGRYNGTQVQDGVYVWSLTYRSDPQEGKEQIKRRGHVTLLR
jgi:gliding motility-associated-like protein